MERSFSIELALEKFIKNNAMMSFNLIEGNKFTIGHIYYQGYMFMYV